MGNAKIKHNKTGCFGTDFKSDILSYLNDKFYMLFVIISAVGSYGFLITHYSVSVDDIEYDRYYFGELIAQGRLTATLFHRVFNLTDNFIWIQDFWGIILLCFSAALFCIIFDKIIQTENHIPQTLFSCLFISYPLHSELFSYNGCSIAIGFGCVLVEFSLLLILQFIESKKAVMIIPVTVLLFFAASWYESVLMIYVGMVFAIFIMKQVKHTQKLKDTIIIGFKFALPLIIAVALEFIISNLVRNMLNLAPSSLASQSLGFGMYIHYNPLYHIKNLIIPIISEFIITSTYYFPITILFICVIIMIMVIVYDLVKKHNASLFFCELATLLLLFNFSFILYTKSEYRTCQYYAFFVAFVAFFIIYRLIIASDKRKIYITFRRIAYCALAVLVFVQINSINYYFTTDNMRYEYEKKVLEDIGDKLTEDFDLSKPVVFIGEIEFPEEIHQRSTVGNKHKLYNWFSETRLYSACFNSLSEFKQENFGKIQETNVQSMINWSMISFEETGMSLNKFYKLLGYDNIKPGTREQVREARLNSDTIPQWPNDGSIVDNGQYIIVKF